MGVCARIDRGIPVRSSAWSSRPPWSPRSTCRRTAWPCSARSGRRAAVGLTGLSWSTLAEPGAARRRGGPRRRDPDRRRPPAPSPSRAATTSTPGVISSASAPGASWPAWSARSPSTPARRDRGPWPPRAAAPRPAFGAAAVVVLSHPGRRRAQGRAAGDAGRVLIFIALRLFHVHDLVAIARFDRVEFALAAVTLLAVVFIGVEQGIGAAVILAMLDRIRLSARPQLHVLGRIPGSTSWARSQPIPTRRSGRESWSSSSPRRSGTPTPCTSARSGAGDAGAGRRRCWCSTPSACRTSTSRAAAKSPGPRCV